MLTLPKQICSEEFQYYSDLPADNLKDEIKKLLDKTWGFNFSVNLYGKFLSDNEFQIKAKWEIGSTPSLFLKDTRIRGLILQDTDKLTQVDLTISPHSLFMPLFFFLPVLMIFTLISFIQRGFADAPSVSLIIFFTILSPFVILALSKFSKRRLLTRFTSYFNLIQI